VPRGTARHVEGLKSLSSGYGAAKKDAHCADLKGRLFFRPRAKASLWGWANSD